MERSLTDSGRGKLAVLRNPEALRWRATFRTCTPLATGSAIRAAPALDVNGDRLMSSVAGHAAAEVSPVPTASPGLLLLHSVGAHRSYQPASIGPTSTCRGRGAIALLQTELRCDPTHGSDNSYSRGCGGRLSK